MPVYTPAQKISCSQCNWSVIQPGHEDAVYDGACIRQCRHCGSGALIVAKLTVIDYLNPVLWARTARVLS